MGGPSTIPQPHQSSTARGLAYRTGTQPIDLNDTCVSRYLSMNRSKHRREHGRSFRHLKLHHACTCFIALLCCAHLLAVLCTIQYEEVWAGLSVRQKLGRSLHVLLVDSYLSRTKADNRAACPITDFVPKVSVRS